MLTIESINGRLLKMVDGYDITEYDAPDDLCGELNYYMNNGWKLIEIKNGAYYLEVDENQLMLVDYCCFNEDLSKYVYYVKVMTHADAHLIRQYFNCEVTDANDTVYALDKQNFTLSDLRFADEDIIKHYYSMEDDNTVGFDLLEIIKEDITNA